MGSVNRGWIQGLIWAWSKVGSKGLTRGPSPGLDLGPQTPGLGVGSGLETEDQARCKVGSGGVRFQLMVVEVQNRGFCGSAPDAALVYSDLTQGSSPRPGHRCLSFQLMVQKK